MRQGRAIGKALGILGFGVLALFVAILASQWLGGPVRAVTIKGSSMEPGLHAGDLVIVKASNDYQVGDAAAYHSEQLGTIVLHRIEDRSGEAFTFKGDNNDWIDLERPGTDRIVGKQWIRIPAVGKGLALMRSPLFLFIALGAAALLTWRSKRRVHGSGTHQARRASSPSGSMQPKPLILAVTGAVAVALLFGFLVLRPSAPEAPEQRSDDVSFGHEGVFSYQAKTEVSPAYQDGAVSTGEPVFLRLVDELDVGFDYTLEAGEPSKIHGSARLTAELSDGSGWVYRFDLSEDQPVTVDENLIRGTLDLDRIATVMEDVQKLTQASGPVYTLKVIPLIHVTGTVAGRPVDDTFRPELPFQFEGARMRLMETGADAAGGSDVLHPTQTNDLDEGSSSSLVSPSVSGLARYKLPLLIVIVTLIALAVGLFITRSTGGADEEAAVARRHGIAVVPVAELPVFYAAKETVDVTSMESLALLASQSGKAILRIEGSGKPNFAVIDDGCVYRYRSHSPSNPVPHRYTSAPPPPSPPLVERGTREASIWGV
jgi:signal peptidase I